MTSNDYDADDHVIEITQVIKNKGEFNVDMVNDDGSINPVALETMFDSLVKETYECECGRRFRKTKTAAQHLLEEQ